MKKAFVIVATMLAAASPAGAQGWHGGGHWHGGGYVRHWGGGYGGGYGRTGVVAGGAPALLLPEAAWALG
jgi:hypothetical protein